MKLSKFEIENFRSIQKISCNTSKTITIFAGKNEAGKTTIFDALGLINENSTINEEDKPVHLNVEEPTVITYYLELTDLEKKEIGDALSLNSQYLKSGVIIKYFPFTKEYEISGTCSDSIIDLLLNTKNAILREVNGKIGDLVKELVQDGIDSNAISQIENLSDVHLKKLIAEIDSILSQIPKIPPTPQNPTPKQNPAIAKIHEFKEYLKSLSMDKQTDKAQKIIWNMRPRVVSFSSFNDTLPHEVPIHEFADLETLKRNRPIVHDLIKLSELDTTKLQANSKLIRHNVTEKASGISSKKFSEFWKQNPIEFVFDIDTVSASIFIRDEGKTYAYRPEQRSDGFQWFLSFFLRLEAAGQNTNNIILVDEPGLYLHYRAQQDVLAVFRKLAENNQVIFTTHSPYLIDADNLNQVRLVVKEDDKTIIKNNFHEGGTDFDTLTPIITALGMDIGKSLFFSKLNYNIVVEGISDYYYLRAMSEYLKKHEGFTFANDITLVPCVGYATVGIMVSFLMAAGLKYKVLLDRKGTTKAANKLKKDGIKEGEILYAGINPEESIEDLFTNNDKIKYELVVTGKSKGIIARNFYERIKTEYLVFESDTVKRFKDVLNQIQNEIKDVQISPEIAKKIAMDVKDELKEKINVQKDAI